MFVKEFYDKFEKNMILRWVRDEWRCLIIMLDDVADLVSSRFGFDDCNHGHVGGSNPPLPSLIAQEELK